MQMWKYANVEMQKYLFLTASAYCFLLISFAFIACSLPLAAFLLILIYTICRGGS